MINKTEAEERQYLKEVQEKLRNSLEELTSKIKKYAQDIREQKEYLWENKSGMDHVEKISVRQSVDQQVSSGEAYQDKSRRIAKLVQSPYFGRFDFIEQGDATQSPIYVGVYAFFDEKDNRSLIHDWRAPISTMFYDYETGQAHFMSPDGKVEGEIVVKRQYRIRKGEMEFLIESDVSIHDDVLQKELSCAADDKMKNIVATIQRDQNAIIRNEKSEVLIIQGVAGSGKTSIALHRIAFLLYRFKDTISSKDLLIISPNKVFADYISNVLPELGEETIPEMGIEELARELLGREYKFQSFFQQVALLLEKNDKAFQKRIQSKASLGFLSKLNEFSTYVKESYFSAVDITVHGFPVPEWFMKEKFDDYKHMPIVNALNKIAKDIEMKVNVYYHYNITANERSKVKAQVFKMFKCQTLKDLYKDFYQWLGQPELHKLVKNSLFEYSDVFPLIYLKMYWEGVKPFEDVKHLLIDEMQDYTPVQYEVLSKLFKCKKTILGDANQSVNPFSSTSSKEIQEAFPGSDCVKLNKSYRSTFEITQFAQNISPNAELEVIERHGQEPELIKFEKSEDELEKILDMIRKFKETDYHSMGIICKTEAQAQVVFDYLKEKERKVYLFTSKSEVFRQGVVVCTAHMSKGLEFDVVIVPEATVDNYKSEVDKSMLYVACTRAMHQLSLTYVSKLTKFVKIV